MDFRSSRANSFLLELTRSKTFLQRLSMSRVIVEVDRLIPPIKRCKSRYRTFAKR